MSSVIDYTKCPQCGGVMYEDYYYNSDEIYCNCNRCGKHYSSELKRDENGKYIRDNDGKYSYEIIDNKGYGSICIHEKGGVSIIYHMREPISQETINTFLKDIEDEHVDKSQCYMTRWNDERQEIESIYGAIPPLYDENNF